MTFAMHRLFRSRTATTVPRSLCRLFLRVSQQIIGPIFALTCLFIEFSTSSAIFSSPPDRVHVSAHSFGLSFHYRMFRLSGVGILLRCIRSKNVIMS